MRRDEVVRLLRQRPKLRRLLCALDDAMAQLSEEEAELLQLLVVDHRRGNAAKLSQKLDISETAVYNRRNKALAKLGRELDGVVVSCL